MSDPREQRPEGQPAPQYGEYAPEGWKAPTVTNSRSSKGDDTRAIDEVAKDPAAHPGPTSSAGAGRIPGVPHNLGASGQARPTAIPPAQPAHSGERTGSSIAPSGPTGERRADRIVTILLLVFGALGALYLAGAIYQLPASIETLVRALEADGLVVPDSLSTIGTVGALVILALYALNLIFSIQRLRARKITFWVPLAAGAIALIVFLACTSFAMAQAPELAQLFSDPDALSKLLAYLGQQS